MIYALIFIIIVLIIERIISEINKNKKEIKEENYTSQFIKKDYLMTTEELKFYKLLKSITDKYNLNIFSQVSLYAIIRNKEYKDFNKIKSKSIDFVITDSNCKIKLCIELDDKTHVTEKRQVRDNFINELFKQVNIKLIRVPVQSYYNLENLEEKIKESL